MQAALCFCAGRVGLHSRATAHLLRCGLSYLVHGMRDTGLRIVGYCVHRYGRYLDSIPLGLLYASLKCMV